MTNDGSLIGNNYEIVQLLNDFPVKNIAGNHVISKSDIDYMIVANTTSTGITITIPSVVNFKHGDTFHVRKAHANNIVSLVAMGTTIDSDSVKVLNTVNSFVTISCDKDNDKWIIVSRPFKDEQGIQRSHTALTALQTIGIAANETFYSSSPTVFTKISLTGYARSLLDSHTPEDFKAGLELGSAAGHNIGTSGATVPLLNGNSDFSEKMTLTSPFGEPSLSFANNPLSGYTSDISGVINWYNSDGDNVFQLDADNLTLGSVSASINNGDKITRFKLDATGAPIVHSGGVFGAWLRTNDTDGRLIGFFRNTNNVGNITASNTGITYATSSDESLKYNITDLESADSIIDALNPVEFTWKDTDKKSVGFIAHEVQEVIPSAVIGEKDGNRLQTLDIKELIPYLVKDFQDVLKEIEKLKEELKNG